MTSIIINLAIFSLVHHGSLRVTRVGDVVQIVSYGSPLSHKTTDRLRLPAIIPEEFIPLQEESREYRMGRRVTVNTEGDFILEYLDEASSSGPIFLTYRLRK